MGTCHSYARGERTLDLGVFVIRRSGDEVDIEREMFPESSAIRGFGKKKKKENTRKDRAEEGVMIMSRKWNIYDNNRTASCLIPSGNGFWGVFAVNWCV